MEKFKLEQAQEETTLLEGIEPVDKRGLPERVKEKLLDVLEPILKELHFDTKGVGEDFEALLAKHSEAKALSAETGEFFRNLIPEGLKEPDVKEVTKAGAINWTMEMQLDRSYQLFSDEVKSLSRSEYRDQKSQILEYSLHGRERTAFREEVTEQETPGGFTTQSSNCAQRQEGGRNLIYESVTNTMDKTRNFNLAESSLVIQDIESGTTLDLNALLPSDFNFIPQYMDRRKLEPDEKSITGYSFQQDKVADLKDYQMGKVDPEGFAEKPGLRIVNYGDLRKKGNILSLLHETAHAWQSKYYKVPEYGRTGFEKLYNEITSLFSKLSLPENAEQYESPEKVWEKLENLGIKCTNKSGTESPQEIEGVLNIPNGFYDVFVSLNNTLSQLGSYMSLAGKEEMETMRSSALKLIRYYPVESEVLKKAMDSYIGEERDAWAHALRTLRFLRQKGLDIEPELKTLKDVKSIIDPCLTSYQDHTVMWLINQKHNQRFVRKPDK